MMDMFDKIVSSTIVIIIFFSLFGVGVYSGKIYQQELNKQAIQQTNDYKVKEMRITGYLPTGNKTALMEDVVVGRTAAVSRECIEFLGSKVYVVGYGVYYVNDLTNKRLDEEFGICTLDIAVSSKEKAYEIGNETSKVIRIDK